MMIKKQKIGNRNVYNMESTLPMLLLVIYLQSRRTETYE